jgi:translation initiation factor eIF-2B subunit epsilon
MGPKTLKSLGSKAKSQDEDKEDVLQAVVIADTFESKFAPFTLERPRCLLPLGNVPILEYTLDFVAQSGVQEVFISAGSHTEQVEKFVNASRWKQKTSPFKKIVFLKSAASSVGDVMRDLDQKGLIAGDFLSVSGDVISNYPVAEALRRHKARRQKDKNAIMTMLLREAGQSHQRSETSSVVSTFVLDSSTDRCLHYEEGQAGERHSLAIDPDMLSHPELDIRQDLVDCRIDICTPEMLSLWSDNFDNQSPRKDFLHGVLKDYELNGKTIHAHVFRDHFADRVGSLRAYDRLSRDIKSRWTFPACPDAAASCDFSRRGTYQEDGVTLARTCRVKPKSIIGRGTSIGDRSLIQNSVIGRNCQIGRNVQVIDSYLWDYVVIEDRAVITHAIIADEAFIGRGCRIEQGALLSFGVRIEQGRQIAAGSRITKARNENVELISRDKELVGGAGEGYAFRDEEDDELEVRYHGLCKFLSMSWQHRAHKIS